MFRERSVFRAYRIEVIERVKKEYFDEESRMEIVQIDMKEMYLILFVKIKKEYRAEQSQDFSSVYINKLVIEEKDKLIQKTIEEKEIKSIG